MNKSNSCEYDIRIDVKNTLLTILVHILYLYYSELSSCWILMVGDRSGVGFGEYMLLTRANIVSRIEY